MIKRNITSGPCTLKRKKASKEKLGQKKGYLYCARFIIIFRRNKIMRNGGLKLGE